MTTDIISTQGLTKDYGNGRGCRDITLTVRAGEAFGFLGPNGAGKSTLVKMLVGLVHPTAGEGFLFGQPVGSIEARRQIGYLPELYRYQEWLTGEEVLNLHAKLADMDRNYARKRIKHLLEEVGIGLRGRDRVKHYSKGMQQRLGFACALMNDPQLLFLDEPSSAMDPVGRHEVRQLLMGLKEQGKTIFLNSHLLEDVEVLCDRVALLNNGNIMAQGTVVDLLEESNRWRLRVGGLTPVLLEWLKETTGMAMACTDVNTSPILDVVWLDAYPQNDEQLGWLNSLIVEQGMTLYEVKKDKNRLNEWFVGAVSGLNQRGERA
ncbi:ABC transporter [Paenibacillus swuensis]|uniref:ABC transporter n=1 Tax=Paenibacillus swuensis TaxID=1178515 RepID=A0A172TKT8_9BACL|nr:ABC transporter ATP-binding protein [Paenibacillus swuensis]ANE47679.1 ABC transporter [Paenibacillus swuensis]